MYVCYYVKKTNYLKLLQFLYQLVLLLPFELTIVDVPLSFPFLFELVFSLTELLFLLLHVPKNGTVHKLKNVYYTSCFFCWIEDQMIRQNLMLLCTLCSQPHQNNMTTLRERVLSLVLTSHNVISTTNDLGLWNLLTLCLGLTRSIKIVRLIFQTKDSIYFNITFLLYCIITYGLHRRLLY